MNKIMQTNLCKSIRACGLPRRESLIIVNTIVKWYDSSGPEWTNQRLKDLKQWYETTLAGAPEPPPWFRHGKDNLPLGIWSYLWKAKNPSKVLAVLSANTLFKEKSLSQTQRNKFLSALAGNGLKDSLPGNFTATLGILEEIEHLPKIRVTSLEEKLPTLDCITASVIPVHDTEALHVSTYADRVQAFRQSWQSVPDATLQFLDDTDHLDWIPVERMGGFGLDIIPKTEVVGRIGLIQEPALKLRAVANPNRVSQAFCEPLARIWEQVIKSLPTDCTYNQERGVRWVQTQLKSGISLSGSDLTSATDLLSLEGSLAFAKSYLHFQDEDVLYKYRMHVKHFKSLSRGLWFMKDEPNNRFVKWEQGQPLGLSPSFRLLAIVNNSLGLIAAYLAGIDNPFDAFRVIGDDIIMKTEMASNYNRLVTSIGGEINLSKTLESNQVAEFAGRVILPNYVSLKTYKFKDPSDTNFMSYVSNLGLQSKGLLRPRQRKVFEAFKYVPGFVVPGPWVQDSYGEPLSTRLGWYLTASGLDDRPLDPDPKVETTEQMLLKLQLSRPDSSYEMWDLPWPISQEEEDAYLASEFSTEARPSGDPRLANGKSTLQVLEEVRGSGAFQEYIDYKEDLPSRSQDAITVKELLLNRGVGEDVLQWYLESMPKDPSSVSRWANAKALVHNTLRELGLSDTVSLEQSVDPHLLDGGSPPSKKDRKGPSLG